MKLIHLSDLHLGKRMSEYSLLEDQKDILRSILTIIDEEKPRGVIIAGDVYDKSIPSAEAVELFDRFLLLLARRGLEVFVISGNHDSPERLAFGGRLMEPSGIHMAPVYNGNVQPIRMEDEHGTVAVWMLPFLKQGTVRGFFPDAQIESCTDALRTAVGAMELDPAERNVLVAHQFVTGAERSESEDLSVGGTDNVDASVFDDFDYVALGHLHKAQNIGSERIRYCGTPLKYSFSEVKDRKSVTVAELGEKGALTVRTVPLTPKHELRELRGTCEELMRKQFNEDSDYRDDYVRVILTNEEDVPDAFAKLRQIYRNLMNLDYDNSRTRHTASFEEIADVRRKSPLQLFAEFFAMQNGSELSEEQAGFVEKLIEKIREDEQ